MSWDTSSSPAPVLTLSDHNINNRTQLPFFLFLISNQFFFNRQYRATQTATGIMNAPFSVHEWPRQASSALRTELAGTTAASTITIQSSISKDECPNPSGHGNVHKSPANDASASVAPPSFGLRPLMLLFLSPKPLALLFFMTLFSTGAQAPSLPFQAGTNQPEPYCC